MKIVYLGSGAIGTPSLRWLLEAGHEVPLVVTQPARPSGRGRKTIPTPIAELARNTLDIPCLEAADVNTSDVVRQIADARPEIILVVAFGQKIGSELLNLPQTHVVNVHASLLPKYRGAAPINWAIIQGETETGLSLFALNEQWDAGAVWGTVSLPIGPNETASEVHDRLAFLGPQLLERTLPEIASGRQRPLPQDDSLACRAPKLKKSDGLIDWSRPAAEVHNRIRGLWSWPGAFTQLSQPQREPLRVIVARTDIQAVQPAPADVTPGDLHPEKGVACGDQIWLAIGQVKPENGRLISFADFINGKHITFGDRFVAPPVD